MHVWPLARDRANASASLGEPIVSASMCPSNDEYAVVGCGNGTVAILSVSEDAVRLVSRLRGHSQEVQSLSWQPGNVLLVL